jgi:hypothetical protein
VVVLVAFALAALGGSDDGDSRPNGAAAPVTAPAPPHAAAESGPCAKVLAELPLQLGRLVPRIVHTTPETPYVVAWGDPAVVLSCGAERPRNLHRTSAAQYFLVGPAGGPYWDVIPGPDDSEVYTTVDRGPYIAVSVPADYQGADVIPPLSEAIAAALPAVCSTDPAAPENDRCTRRP